MPTTQASDREAAAPAEPPRSSAPPQRGHNPSRWLLPAMLALAVCIVASIVAYRAGVSASAPAAGTTPTTLAADPVDIGFAQDMLDHHDQAIQIATYAQAHAESPMVRAMAAAVIGSQRYEIGVLEKFLEDRGSARGDRNRTVMGWMNMPVPADQMPGLQPAPAIVEFLNEQGPSLDRRFLELMIDHHQGGVHMAEYAGGHAENESLRNLARRMVVDQRTEIGDYQSALQALN